MGLFPSGKNVVGSYMVFVFLSSDEFPEDETRIHYCNVRGRTEHNNPTPEFECYPLVGLPCPGTPFSPVQIAVSLERRHLQLVPRIDSAALRGVQGDFMSW